MKKICAKCKSINRSDAVKCEKCEILFPVPFPEKRDMEEMLERVKDKYDEKKAGTPLSCVMEHIDRIIEGKPLDPGQLPRGVWSTTEMPNGRRIAKGLIAVWVVNKTKCKEMAFIRILARGMRASNPEDIARYVKKIRELFPELVEF